ncbi:CDP-glycerol glycerophosphotransferase family protein [Streptomyces odontomachi]|uniref:CDP-glycerol glycerophosphotransferase family protein n=1 Tax=Streptomyces odontomachi TaxID=2944940 RepID=UPI00210CA23D|nr:CDP-glycerol glycerophosphotransferase family protein [Streptomyces sp. ODS25]
MSAVPAPPSSPRLRRLATHLPAPLLLSGAFAGQAVGALRPNGLLLVAAVLAGMAAEGLLHRRQRVVAAALAKVHADAALRQVLRDLLLVAGLVRLDIGTGHVRCLPLVYGLLCFYALHFAGHGAALLVRRSRTLPVVTRNIDTTALGLTPAPPPLLMRRPGRRILSFGLPGTAGLLVAAVTGVPEWGAVGVSVSIGCAAATLGELLLRLLPGRRAPGEEQVLQWLDAWLAAYRPTVGMYFSGGTSSAYQANMWLEPLARLDGRPLIVLRERFMVQKIAATDIPIVCIPKVAHLMRLEHTTLRVLIHPANSGKTSQVLRIPSLKHAFVNHGESDKLSSCNPYAKAYDEVWVAGLAARARYALADVGIDDRDVVEIGRPQLAAIRPYAGPPTGPYVTVLYAPTWEGWDGNPGNTSVIDAGENIVRALLAEPGVRLLYKPHPMTGSVDARAAAANDRVQALIHAANAAWDAARQADGHQGAGRPGAVLELARRTAALDRLTTCVFRRGADDMERMGVQGTPEPGRAAAVAAATAAWEAAYWASLPAGRHQIVPDARPALYSCFNQADLLISDVSSVISDYLASEKPYAVANTSGLTEDAFRIAFPTVRAATVLTPDAVQVPLLVRSVRDPRLDEWAAARAELKEELLGPAEPPSVVRFADAARALARAAADHQERMARRMAAAVPGQAGARDRAAIQEAADIPGQQGAAVPAPDAPGGSRIQGRGPTAG